MDPGNFKKIKVLIWLFGCQFSHKLCSFFPFITAEQLPAQFASAKKFPEHL